MTKTIFGGKYRKVGTKEGAKTNKQLCVYLSDVAEGEDN